MPVGAIVAYATADCQYIFTGAWGLYSGDGPYGRYDGLLSVLLQTILADAVSFGINLNCAAVLTKDYA